MYTKRVSIFVSSIVYYDDTTTDTFWQLFHKIKVIIIIIIKYKDCVLLEFFGAKICDVKITKPDRGLYRLGLWFRLFLFDVKSATV